jgi:hypothetical protein
VAEGKLLTHQVNENVGLKQTKEKKKVAQTVEVMHPWKQPKPEELRAKRRTPFNDNLKHPRPLLHMPPPETVPSSGPRRPSHYISESGAFEINAMGKQLVINPVPSLPAADAQRKRFMFENMSLFADSPARLGRMRCPG